MTRVSFNTLLYTIVRVLFIVQRLSLVVMVGVMCSLVLTRYAFHYSPSWSEELTVYLMIWNAMLGAGALVLFNDHIALLFVVDAMPTGLRRFMAILVQVLVLLSAILFLVYGYRFTHKMADSMSMGLGISTGWAALAIPVGGAFMTVAAAIRLYDEIRKALGHPPLIDERLQSAFTDSRFQHAQ